MKPRVLQALLAAFPTRNELEQMLLFGLNVRLNEIAAESLNLTDTTFKVIDYFDRHGQRRDLIEAARETNPGNPALKALAESLPPPSTAVRVRRTAHHYPRHAYLLLLGIVLGLTALMVTATKADLTEQQLTIVKGVLGVGTAVLMGVVPKRWRLKIGDAAVYGGAVAALLLTFITPARAGLMVVNGRVFYEGTLRPVSSVVVTVRGTTTLRSQATPLDGSFVLESVPSTARELYFSWPGGEDRKATIETPTGGEYRVIPKPVDFVLTPPIDVPPSAWKRVRPVDCPRPHAAFALDMTIPSHPAAAPAFVDIILRAGVRFLTAVTAIGRGYTLSADRASRRRWIFENTTAPVKPQIVVCLEAGASATPEVDDMTVTYFYEEKK